MIIVRILIILLCKNVLWIPHILAFSQSYSNSNIYDGFSMTKSLFIFNCIMHTINSILCYLLKIHLEMVTSGDIARAIAKTLGKNHTSVLNQRCHAFGSKEKLAKLNGS